MEKKLVVRKRVQNVRVRKLEIRKDGKRSTSKPDLALYKGRKLFLNGKPDPGSGRNTEHQFPGRERLPGTQRFPSTQRTSDRKQNRQLEGKKPQREPSVSHKSYKISRKTMKQAVFQGAETLEIKGVLENRIQQRRGKLRSRFRTAHMWLQDVRQPSNENGRKTDERMDQSAVGLFSWMYERRRISRAYRRPRIIRYQILAKADLDKYRRIPGRKQWQRRGQGQKPNRERTETWNPTISRHRIDRMETPKANRKRTFYQTVQIRHPQKNEELETFLRQMHPEQQAKLLQKAEQKVQRKKGRRGNVRRMGKQISGSFFASKGAADQRMDRTILDHFGRIQERRPYQIRFHGTEEKKAVEKEVKKLAQKRLRLEQGAKQGKRRYLFKLQAEHGQAILHRMAKKTAYAAEQAMKKAAVAAARTMAVGVSALLGPLGAVLLAVLLIAGILGILFGGSIQRSGPDGTQVVSYAVSFVGKIPYYYGGGREYQTLEEIVAAGGMADCSAFTQRVFRHFGAEIGSTTYEQQHAGTAVSGSLEPGDLLLFNNHSSGAQPGHVGIYMGDGNVVHEGGGNYTGNVKIDPLSAFTVMSVRRIAVVTSEGDFSGKDVPEICYHFFLSQGFSEAAACGILGNIQWESGFRTDVLEQGGADSGHGLCQWGDAKTGGRFYALETFAANRGKPWTDLETQLWFVIEECNGSIRPYFDTYAGGVEAYKRLTDPAAAALLWLKCYEMCGPYDPAIANESKRVDSARSFYQQFAR